MTNFVWTARARRAAVRTMVAATVAAAIAILPGCGGPAAPAGSASQSDAGSATASAAPAGKETYERFCVSCHAVGAAGAPRLGDKAAWAPRIAKGTDAMVATVTTGLNAMPPKGACISCTEAELRASVEYMVSQSR